MMKSFALLLLPKKDSLAKRPVLFRSCFTFLFLFAALFSQATPFITTWQTDNSGTSNNDQITIPGTGTYTVDWVDVNDSGNNGSTSGTGSVTVTFPSAGTYEVSIPSGLTQIYFNNGGDKLKLLTIEQWGSIAWTSMASAFKGCSNLTYNATDKPDLSSVTSMSAMFASCTNFNGAIGSWDVSNVTNMSHVFNYASAFNQDLSAWDVSSVNYMGIMFMGASSFNQNISGWDVSNVLTMPQMFSYATSFNQNIGSWVLSSLNDMAFMFHGASSFNQNISGWNVSNVTNMRYLFSSASAFNQDISGWNVSNVADMTSLFRYSTAFNQDLSSWDLSSVTSMTNMLDGSGLSVTNYDNTLIGWEAQAVSGMSLGANNLNYCNGETARDALITDGWTISGDSKDCSTFPVEWLSFSGTATGESIELIWQTANETNSDFFEIERSSDRQNWQILDRVNASGYSSKLQSYHYEDEDPIANQAYYRLRQQDFDGAFAFSNIIQVYSPPSEPKVSVFPNPVKDILELEWELTGTLPVRARLLDLQGRRLLEQEFNSSQHQVYVSELPKGIYVLLLSNPDGWRREIRFMKE